MRTLLGEENGRRGAIKMFEVLQDTRLNKHLFYVSMLTSLVLIILIKKSRTGYQGINQYINIWVVFTLKSTVDY